MPEFKDLTGKQFGKWIVVSQARNHVTKNGNTFTKWFCRCECGNEKEVFANSLLNGRSKSCGCDNHKHTIVCKNNFTTHGASKTRLYKIWAGMHKRCENNNTSNYSDYGGRGITVCHEWDDFVVFKDWALKNGYTDSLSIDRIDVNGCYCPDNCRWSTKREQANNRRNTKLYNAFGKTQPLSVWANECGKSYKYLHKRLSKGQSLEEIINSL